MEKDNVPFIVFESATARLERTIKRLWILCIIVFLAFVVSNGLWIYYESQWEVVETTEQTIDQDVSTRNGSVVMTGIGDINGSSTSDSNNEDN